MSLKKKSFREVHRLDVQQWELRRDPRTGMRLLFNRIEGRNYWPWQYPEVAKELGVEIPKKKIFKKRENKKLELIPPPPPPDAIPRNDDIDSLKLIPPTPPQPQIIDDHEDQEDGDGDGDVVGPMGLPPPVQNEEEEEENEEKEHEEQQENVVLSLPPPPPDKEDQEHDDNDQNESDGHGVCGEPVSTE